MIFHVTLIYEGTVKFYSLLIWKKAICDKLSASKIYSSNTILVKCFQTYCCCRNCYSDTTFHYKVMHHWLRVKEHENLIKIYQKSFGWDCYSLVFYGTGEGLLRGKYPSMFPALEASRYPDIFLAMIFPCRVIPAAQATAHTRHFLGQ